MSPHADPSEARLVALRELVDKLKWQSGNYIVTEKVARLYESFGAEMEEEGLSVAESHTIVALLEQRINVLRYRIRDEEHRLAEKRESATKFSFRPIQPAPPAAEAKP